MTSPTYRIDCHLCQGSGVIVGPETRGTLRCDRCEVEKDSAPYLDDHRLARRIREHQLALQAVRAAERVACPDCGHPLIFPSDPKMTMVQCEACDATRPLREFATAAHLAMVRDDLPDPPRWVPCHHCDEFGIEAPTGAWEDTVACASCERTQQTSDYRRAFLLLGSIRGGAALGEITDTLALARDGVDCPYCGAHCKARLSEAGGVACEHCGNLTPWTHWVTPEMAAVILEMETKKKGKSGRPRTPGLVGGGLIPLALGFLIAVAAVLLLVKVLLG